MTQALTKRVAVLVGVQFGREGLADPSLDEVAALADTAGLTVTSRMLVRRQSPDPALFVGSGKASELKAVLGDVAADVVVFDQPLGAAQQRNLCRFLGVEVFDRTHLILDIFAQRAQSHEGKLQVELARLSYLSTRLVGRWSHLERQRGGVGLRGGPGETQMELDRRMIGERVKTLRHRLAVLKRQRDTQQRRRRRQGSFRVALVGYTNAGKSTLFNALVKARAYSADQLFATLDTTTRQMYLPAAGSSVSLSDTVGFIRDLPHDLIEAFEATLDEAAQADLLLHVVDGASPHAEAQMNEVQKVIASIGAAEIPQILVFNKIDRVFESYLPQRMHDEVMLGGRELQRVFVSASAGVGLDQLRSAIATRALMPVSLSGSDAADPRGLAARQNPPPKPRFEPQVGSDTP
jgi:GTP-binding protein HflX